MTYCKNKNCNQSFIASEDAECTILGYCSDECMPSLYIGIDPGDMITGWALWNGEKFMGGGNSYNVELLDELDTKFSGVGSWTWGSVKGVCIEAIGNQGAGKQQKGKKNFGVGRNIFDTCIWTGIFVNEFQRRGHTPDLILRATIKTIITGRPGCKDKDVTDALKDQIGEKGTKKHPGPLFGISSHAWQALACAVAMERGGYNPLQIFSTDRGEGIM